jgi:hypothetical protein
MHKNKFTFFGKEKYSRKGYRSTAQNIAEEKTE